LEITLLKSKIHRATVTATELGYVGSVTLGAALMRAAGLYPYEKVLVVDLDNGRRLETYCIEGGEKGVVCLNGAAARLVSKGDKVIVMSFASMDPKEAESHEPKIVFVDGHNEVVTVKSLERPGPFLAQV
jgi:aspartate 1-decarboxylase